MGFFAVISTRNNLSAIGNSVKSFNFPEINIDKEIPDFKRRMSSDSEINTPNTETDNVILNQSDNLFQNQNSDWQTYTNEQYGFTVNYSKDWGIDTSQSTDTGILFEKIVLQEVANIRIEIVSQTQEIKSAEEGIDRSISQMKDIIKPKEKIIGGKYEGYDVIGTVCTKICNGSSDDIYSPFSVIYFSNNDIIIKVKYSEGTLGLGWKEGIKDWKFYDEYKSIISTFKFTNIKNQ